MTSLRMRKYLRWKITSNGQRERRCGSIYESGRAAIPLLGIVVIWTNLPEIRAFLRTGEALQYASEQGAN